MGRTTTESKQTKVPVILGRKHAPPLIASKSEETLIASKIVDVSPADVSKHQPTKFQLKVYLLTQCIPSGKVTTYGTMAKVLGSSPRAIGQALRRNPFAPIVPCHRIVASTGSLTGFGGETDQKALDKKKSLLAKENVKVVANSVIPSNVVEEDDLDRIWQAVIAK